MWSDSCWLEGEAIITSWSRSTFPFSADHKVNVLSLTDNSLSAYSTWWHIWWDFNKDFQCMVASMFKSPLVISVLLSFNIFSASVSQWECMEPWSNPCGICLWRIFHSAFTAVSLWFRIEVCWFSSMRESKCGTWARVLPSLVGH